MKRSRGQQSGSSAGGGRRTGSSKPRTGTRAAKTGTGTGTGTGTSGRRQSGQPQTSARTGTGAAEENPPPDVVSVCENRARQVCVAALAQLERAEVTVWCFHDSYAYRETLMLLEDMRPANVLLPDGTDGRVLTGKILNLQRSKYTFVPRSTFDQTRGAEVLSSLLRGRTDPDEVFSLPYIVLAGVHAILKYIESTRGVFYAAGTLALTQMTGRRGQMILSQNTIRQLELVSNRLHAQQRESLYGAINCTTTAVGARLLKTNILTPCTDIPTLQTRQGAVELLLSYPNLMWDVRDSLEQFFELDSLINSLTTTRRPLMNGASQQDPHQQAKKASKMVQSLLLLKSTLEMVPHLAERLKLILDAADVAAAKGAPKPAGRAGIGAPLRSQSQSPAPSPSQPPSQSRTPPVADLLRVVHQNLADVRLQDMHDLLTAVLAESSQYATSQRERTHQACFAVREGVHGLLDVARQTLLQSIEEIYTTTADLQESVGVQIEVAYTEKRGHHLKINMHDVGALPEDHPFVQTVQFKKHVACTTETVASLSDRAAEAADEALVLSCTILQDTLDGVRGAIEPMFGVVESIAMLDMLVSFAAITDRVAGDWTRPELNASGALVMRASRHPIHCCGVIARHHTRPQHQGFQPNDVFLAHRANFIVITGANGAGKTTFLKQIALLLIMAHIGSFVPAREATVPVFGQIFGRLGVEDDLEANLSTFLTEMRDMAQILSSVSPRLVVPNLNTSTKTPIGVEDAGDARGSEKKAKQTALAQGDAKADDEEEPRTRTLVLVDELGRGTGCVDGIALAWASSEALLSSQAWTLFVTHAIPITRLAVMYPVVRNAHMASREEPSRAGQRQSDSVRVTPTYELRPGPCASTRHYGIAAAEQCGMPTSLVADAKRSARAFGDLKHLAANHVTRQDRVDAVLNELIERVVALKGVRVSDEELKSFLLMIRKKLPAATAEHLKQRLRDDVAP